MQPNYALKPIKTEADYEAAMDLLKSLWDAKPGMPEADQLEILGILIDQYEAQQVPTAAQQLRPCYFTWSKMEKLGIFQRIYWPNRFDKALRTENISVPFSCKLPLIKR